MWTKQIASSLSWILAFIRGQDGSIKRTFSYDSCFGISAPVFITTDASIYGYGAWISLAGRPIAWFIESISKDDETVLGHKMGENQGQQGFEAMCLLIAVRVWAPIWKNISRNPCFAQRQHRRVDYFLFFKRKILSDERSGARICVGHG